MSDPQPPSQPAARRPPGWALWAALAAALALLGLYAVEIRHWMLDDAFISFRYAENFAAGKGLVFNEGERVEGYTTFLWVFVLGLGNKLGFDTVASSRWLGAAFAAGCLLLLAASGRFVRGIDAGVAALALLMVASSGVFATWTLAGMEVPLVGFLGLLGMLLYLKARAADSARLYAAAGVVCALAAMTRPDAGLLFVTLVADRLIDRVRTGRGGWLPLTLGLAVLYAPYFAWRYLYYGWLLPNTFYAKVGGTVAQLLRGWDYFTRFSGASLLILCAAAAGLVAAGAMRRRFGPVRVVAVYLLLHTAYVVAVGGDAQPSFRFFGEVMPLLGLWSAMGFAALAPGGGRQLGFALLVVAFNLLQAFHQPNMLPFVGSDKVAERGRHAGLWLRQNADPDAVIATNTAGSIPYYSRLRAIDMLGLNDSHIAHRDVATMGAGIAGHEKSDGDYVVERRPDYIMFDSATGSRKPRRPSDEQIWKNEDFQRLYRFRTFRVGDGRSFFVYVLERDPPS